MVVLIREGLDINKCLGHINVGTNNLGLDPTIQHFDIELMHLKS